MFSLLASLHHQCVVRTQIFSRRRAGIHNWARRGVLATSDEIAAYSAQHNMPRSQLTWAEGSRLDQRLAWLGRLGGRSSAAKCRLAIYFLSFAKQVYQYSYEAAFKVISFNQMGIRPVPFMKDFLDTSPTVCIHSSGLSVTQRLALRL
jgi:hypothetical protein